ncbi:hypothetical protein [Gluconacetobacter sacchari]|uniref:Uncharacterized protein n=1 Tax=Gluconacetobacter sacchari TaxID=92759 RepID=A0A7W4IGJ5_9PROT|nr:hypothetical protein [Gluconacetobacter sacchari]MBB2162397.1 hypothetical protein [Gluconacetobacter sacchari]
MSTKMWRYWNEWTEAGFLESYCTKTLFFSFLIRIISVDKRTALRLIMPTMVAFFERYFMGAQGLSISRLAGRRLVLSTAFVIDGGRPARIRIDVATARAWTSVRGGILNDCRHRQAEYASIKAPRAIRNLSMRHRRAGGRFRPFGKTMRTEKLLQTKEKTTSRNHTNKTTKYVIYEKSNE